METLIRYKYFAREYLAKEVQVFDITEFLMYITTNEAFNSLYSVPSFFSELESIESHYSSLRYKISFYPYYESLRSHVVAYSPNVTDENEKKALVYLYTALVSRIFAIKSHANHVGVVNLVEYVRTIEKQMKQLKEIKKHQYIAQYRDDFKSTLNSKIESAIELIHKIIIPQIDSTYNEVDESIKVLLEELSDKKHETEAEIAKAEENKRKLTTLMVGHLLTGMLKMVGCAISALGPEMMVVGAAFGIAGGIAENAVESANKLNTVSVPKDKMQENLAYIAGQSKKNIIRVLDSLNALRKDLSDEDSDGYGKIIKKIDESTPKLEEYAQSSKIIDSETMLKFPNDVLEGVGKVTSDLVEELAPELAKKNPNPKIVKRFKRAKSIGQGVEAIQVGFEGIAKVAKDSDGINDMNEIIGELKNRLKMIAVYEQSIYNIMIPQVQLVEESLNEAIENAEGKSHVQLDISKWAVRNTLRQVKQMLDKMTEGFTVAPDIARCIEQLNDGMATIMDIYDRIDSYMDRAQLASLIADIEIGSRNEISDQNLREAVSRMQIIINSNLVMEQYETAMNALKQHTFPFVEYLDQYRLPTDLNTTEVGFTDSVLDHVRNLAVKHTQKRSLIEVRDGYLYGNYSFTNNESLFVWDTFHYKDQIVELINGETVTLVADINDGLKLSAIKFNEVWLKFRLKDPIVQSEFDELLQGFSIVMNMVGNSFYRCDKRFYYMPLENTVRIAFSMERGQPNKPNEIYSKLKNGDPFLSPYSTWKVTLLSKQNNAVDFKRLNRYRNNIIGIALEGRGQCLDNNIDFTYSICNEHLDNYYRFDSFEHISFD